MLSVPYRKGFQSLSIRFDLAEHLLFLLCQIKLWLRCFHFFLWKWKEIFFVSWPNCWGAVVNPIKWRLWRVSACVSVFLSTYKDPRKLQTTATLSSVQLWPCNTEARKFTLKELKETHGAFFSYILCLVIFLSLTVRHFMTSDLKMFFSILKWIKFHRRANLTKAISALFGYLETEASSI